MFTSTDIGCWIDGAGGMERTRMVMANMLAKLYRHHPRGGAGLYWESDVKEIVETLDGPMSDDDWETTEALEWLNKACETGIHFELEGGDLILLRDDER